MSESRRQIDRLKTIGLILRAVDLQSVYDPVKTVQSGGSSPSMLHCRRSSSYRFFSSVEVGWATRHVVAMSACFPEGFSFYGLKEAQRVFYWSIGWAFISCMSGSVQLDLVSLTKVRLKKDRNKVMKLN